MAPMKTLTIPRLELCASVLLARWMASISRIYDSMLAIYGMYAWSDSQVALSWIMNSNASFKVFFISNRVHQVYQLMPSCHWNVYVQLKTRRIAPQEDSCLQNWLHIHYIGLVLHFSKPNRNLEYVIYLGTFGTTSRIQSCDSSCSNNSRRRVVLSVFVLHQYDQSGCIDS